MKVIFLLSMLFLFSACENETDESKRYEIFTLLDNGDFNTAIEKLNSCEENSFFSESECLLNRGMAYFGLAGYDITSIGEEIYRVYVEKEINDEERSRQIMTLVFKRFKGFNISLALENYRKVLYINGELESSCTSLKFKSLSEYVQQACISINPVLLLEVIDDETINVENYLVDLGDLVDFEKSIRGTLPTLTDRELVDILNGDTSNLSTSSQNELDASLCATIDESCEASGFQKIKISNFEDLDIWKISNGSYTTLKLTDVTGSVVLVETDKYIDHEREVCLEESYFKFDGDCFPKPQNLDNPTTLTTEIADKLNYDEDFQNSLGVILNVGDDTSTSDEKVNEFISEIKDGDNFITDDNLIEYFRGL
jgi:hypothetical protein